MGRPLEPATIAASQLVLLSLPQVQLLSGVSPCPELEAPSGVNLSLKLVLPAEWRPGGPGPGFLSRVSQAPYPELDAPT